MPSAINAFGACWLVLQWQSGTSVALADAMGKGKTHTVLAALALWTELGHVGTGQQALVVSPSKLRIFWRGEARRWTPTLKVVEPQVDVAFTLPDQRRSPRQAPPPSAAVGARLVPLPRSPACTLVTYEAFNEDHIYQLLLERAYTVIILDESHGFESEASATRRHVDELRRAGAIIVGINGTPTSGSLLSVVRFLGALGDDVAHRVDAVRVAVQRRVLRREIPPATWTVVAQTRYVQTTPSQLAAAKVTLARCSGLSFPLSSVVRRRG